MFVVVVVLYPAAFSLSLPHSFSFSALAAANAECTLPGRHVLFFLFSFSRQCLLFFSSTFLHSSDSINQTTFFFSPSSSPRLLIVALVAFMIA